MSVLALAVTGRGLVDPLEPVIRADDEGLLRGRAAFETLRVYGGRPFRLEEHLDRLTASAASIDLPAVERRRLQVLVGLVLPKRSTATHASAGVDGRPAGGLPSALALPADPGVDRSGRSAVPPPSRCRGARVRAVASSRREVDELRVTWPPRRKAQAWRRRGAVRRRGRHRPEGTVRTSGGVSVRRSSPRRSSSASSPASRARR